MSLCNRQPNHRSLSAEGIEAMRQREQQACNYPISPFGHFAVISGPGSEEYSGGNPGISVLGPNEVPSW